MVRYAILGPVELCDGERRLGVGGPRQVALLALLLVNANRALSSDRLIDALWGDLGPGGAVKRLQVAIARLRPTLDGDGARGESVLRTVANGYLLAVRPGELDAEVFQSRTEEGRRALEGGEVACARDVLREALGMWRGPALAEVAYEEFAQPEIRRLEELRLAALEARVDCELQLGEHGGLIGELGALVAAHPGRERLAAQLMLSLYRCGRQGDALEVYARARAYLLGELGLEPGPALKMLQRAILEQAPSLDLRSAAASERAPHAGDSRGPFPTPLPGLVARLRGRYFVGRDNELERLRSHWHEAGAKRERRIVLLTGEPGIGKSTLAARFAGEAHAGGAIVLHGRADQEALVPYQPFAEALRHLARHGPLEVLRAAASDLGELSGFVPEFRRRLPEIPEPRGQSGGDDRYRLFAAIDSLLVAAAERSPLLLLLDDLHWAERSTLRLLLHVARGSDPAPILVLGISREREPGAEHLTAALADLRREGLEERISLGGLQEDGVTQLVAAALASVPPGLAGVLLRETEGNPFFLVEMVRHLAEAGEPCEDVPTTSELLARVGIPEGAREVIEHRLARLSAEAQGALALAAVLGPQFDAEALAAMMEAQPADVDGPLQEAVSAALVDEVADGNERFTFSHALVRETLYRRGGSAQRGALHRRAGVALERLYADELEDHASELAHHFLAAGRRVERDKPIGYAVLAAEQAIAGLAYEEAAEHLARALERCKRDIQRCELLLGLGEARRMSGDAAQAKAAFEAAAEQARVLGAREHFARAALGAGGGRRNPVAAGLVDRPVIRLLEEALDGLDASDSPLRAAVLGRLAVELYWSSEQQRREALSREAVEVAGRLSDPTTLGDALLARRFAVWGPDDLEERLATGPEILRMAHEAGDRDLAIRGHRWRIADLLEVGDLDGVRREVEAVARVSEIIQQPLHFWTTRASEAMLALAEGRLGDAERLASESYAIGDRAGEPDAPHGFAIQTFFLMRDQGRLEDLVALAQPFAEQYPAIPAWRCGLAALYSELGRDEEAGRELESFAAHGFETIPRDMNWVFSLAYLAEVAASLRDSAAATALYDLLVPYGDRNLVTGYTAAISGSVARYLGLLAAALSRFDVAARHFESALQANASMRARPWLARTQYDYAEMLLTRDEPGDADRAAHLSARALRAASEIGMKALIAKIERTHAR